MAIDLFVVINTMIDYNGINNVYCYIGTLSVMKNEEGEFKGRLIHEKREFNLCSRIPDQINSKFLDVILLDKVLY